MGLLRRILLSAQSPQVVENPTSVPPNHMSTSAQPTELMPPTQDSNLYCHTQGLLPGLVFAQISPTAYLPDVLTHIFDHHLISCNGLHSKKAPVVNVALAEF